MNVTDFSKIKLIIWDLDDTLWHGTLSEGNVSLCNTNKELLRILTDCGVVNSICSKNTDTEVEAKLTEFEIDEFFVFKSINWEPKGQRIKNLINNMSLRAPNVLFIDDNTSNLKEAEFYSEGLMTAEPSIIPELYDYFVHQQPKDKEHKRLKQYIVLEEKFKEQQSFSSNEEFLKSCDIHIQFHENVLEREERLYELVLRTNQLNFTKKRPTQEEFAFSLRSAEKSGYITVQDRFGDYGIVGMYLIENGELNHFLFSCRTIGQGVEQYVYAKLGFPKVNIVQPVATTLNCQEIPSWISEGELTMKCPPHPSQLYGEKYLLKGPCDMSAMVAYLGDAASIFDTEMTFVDNEGRSVVTYNHAAHILMAAKLSEKRISEIVNECFFLTEDFFKTNLFSESYDIVFLSTLLEGVFGLYKRKGSGEIVAYGQYCYPITNPENWDKYINGTVDTCGVKVTEEGLREFCGKYEFIGRTTVEFYHRMLDEILHKTNSVLCIILGQEIPYEAEIGLVHLDRHQYQKELNCGIRSYASQHKDRIRLIELSSYVTKQSDFHKTTSHFTPKVYYNLAQDVLETISSVTGQQGLKANKFKYIFRQYVKVIITAIIGDENYNSFIKGIKSKINKR